MHKLPIIFTAIYFFFSIKTYEPQSKLWTQIPQQAAEN